MGDAEREVEIGLDGFAANRTVKVPLRDLLYAYKAIGEFVRFVHQPLHYPDLDAVLRFIGDKDEGGLHVLVEAYYRRLRDVWPEDVRHAFDAAKLETPSYPE